MRTRSSAGIVVKLARADENALFGALLVVLPAALSTVAVAVLRLAGLGIAAELAARSFLVGCFGLVVWVVVAACLRFEGMVGGCGGWVCLWDEGCGRLRGDCAREALRDG